MLRIHDEGRFLRFGRVGVFLCFLYFSYKRRLRPSTTLESYVLAVLRAIERALCSGSTAGRRLSGSVAGVSGAVAVLGRRQ